MPLALAQTAPPLPPDSATIPPPPPAGLSPELAEVNSLIRGGQYAAAASRLDAMLAKDPRNAQLRFMKAVALNEQGQADNARDMYQALTQDYPELPEPYNNLAVILAQQGRYADARTALELALKARPDYGIAHENLGDVYARMAGLEYGRSLEIDRTNSSAQKKLALMKDLYAVLPSSVVPNAAPPRPATPRRTK